MLNCLLLGVGD